MSTTNSSPPIRATSPCDALTSTVKALGKADEQLVTDAVAKCVVDQFEVVEVEIADADPPVRIAERRREAVEEERAVGNPVSGSCSAW